MRIRLRLRTSLRFWSRRDIEIARACGYGLDELTPLFVVPARTTLTVLDVFSEGAYCADPSGRQFMVSREKIRAHGYTPRSAT